MLQHGDDGCAGLYDDSMPLGYSSHLQPSSHFFLDPLKMNSSSSSNSLLADEFPYSWRQASYNVHPSERDKYDITSPKYVPSNYRNLRQENLNEMIYQVDREYHTMEAVQRGNMGRRHRQSNYQIVDEDERYTKPGCIRSSLNDVIDLLFSKYRQFPNGRGTSRRPVKASYTILSPRHVKRFESSAIDFASPERQGSFDSIGSFERARQFIRDVSHRTSNGVSELQNQLKAMVQDRALRQTQRDVSIPSTSLEDEKLAESRRMLQLQIEQHQAAMANHMAAMQAHYMSPMYTNMVKSGMVNGMMNHQQLNAMFTHSSQESSMGVGMPEMMHHVDMSKKRINTPGQQIFYHENEQQDQRDPSESASRSNSNDRFYATNQQQKGTTCSLPRVVKVANGTKLVFSQQNQNQKRVGVSSDQFSRARSAKVANGTKMVLSQRPQSDASTIQSIQETVERAMKKSDAARMQRDTSKKLWSQASRIRA